MSFFKGTIHSDVLNMNTALNVILPDRNEAESTLILLHGYSDNADAWLRRTGIDRYASKYNMAVFMPEVQHSFYIDMAYGLPYFTYVSKELPKLIQHDFKVPKNPLYIGGLSMGGYGALKCAVTYPEQYAGCISLSSRFYLDGRKSLDVMKSEVGLNEWRGVVGMDLKVQPENDLELVIEKTINEKRKFPPIYLACGTEDVLYLDTVNMHEFMKEKHVAHCYEEWPGEHNWDFWDVGIQKGLKYLSDISCSNE